MTYKEFISMLKDDVAYLENLIIDSQMVNMKDEMAGEDDTIVLEYQNLVEENMANITGHHAWVVTKEEA